MDRQDFFSNVVAYERAKLMIVFANTEYPDYDPLDLPTRDDVCPGTYLKEGDDVACYSGALLCRVICAAPSRDSFYAWWMDPEVGATVGVNQVQYVTDRAPADPEEEGMPNDSIYIPSPSP
jgi:hypothetical protein